MAEFTPILLKKSSTLIAVICGNAKCISDVIVVSKANIITYYLLECAASKQ